MRAALFDDINSMKIIEKEIPTYGPDEVLLKVVNTGICGSEIHAYNGTHPFRKPPSILGHEVVGIIKEVGSNIADFQVGDHVTVEPQFGCDTCDHCQKGLYHLCDYKTVLGTPKWEGSFAEYMVAPAKTIYKLPKELPANIGVLTEPLAVGVHAVNLANIEKGDKVAILGAGPIGLLTAVAAHNKGAERIVITDAQEHNLKAGKKLGVTDTVNITNENVVDYVKKHLGSVNKVFLTVGFDSIVDDAFEIVTKRGKIISIAIFEGKTGIDLNRLFLSEIQLLGSSMYVREDYEEAVEIVSHRKYPLEILSKHTFTLEETSAAMEAAATKKDGEIKVCIEI